MSTPEEISSFLTSRRARISPEQAGVPVFGGARLVQNARLDFVATNALGAALYSLPEPSKSGELFNAALFQLLDPRAEDFSIDFARAKRNVVALLHQAAGRDPFNDALIRLIGRLSTQSAEFRALWASHDVIRYQRGTKRYRHPDVGDLEFGYESFDLTTEPGLTLLVYTIEPNSPTADRMALLASWAKTAAVENDAAPNPQGAPSAARRPTQSEIS